MGQCFWITRVCWSWCIFFVTVLAGIQSVPEGTLIATGRERLICVVVSLASLGVSKNKYHKVIRSFS